MTCQTLTHRSNAVPQHAQPDIATLAQQHGAIVFRAAYRVLGDRSQSEDVQQEVFLRLLESRPKGVDCWAAYLSTCGSRAAINRLRRQQRWWRLLPLWRMHVVAEAPSAEADLAQRERAEQLRSALGALSQREAQCFGLRYLQDMTVGEIASALALSENNVSVILHRARQRIEARIASFNTETIA